MNVRNGGMRGWLAAGAGILCAIGVAVVVGAQVPEGTTMTAPPSTPWPAVGRLDRAGRADFCTGVLIAPALVLTVAHCVGGSPAAPGEPGHITFRAGHDRGVAFAVRDGVGVTVHPAYHGRTTAIERFGVDLALVDLAAPVEGVAPLQPGPPPERGTAVSLLTYIVGHGDSLDPRLECPVLGQRDGLLVLGCAVSGGASGAPVVANGQVVATVVARGGTADAPFALAVPLDAALPALLAVHGTRTGP